MLYDYFITYNRYLNIIGIAVILGIAYFFSHNRAKINWRLVMSGLCMQISIGFFVLRTQIGVTIFGAIAAGVSNLYACADDGARFIFGNLLDAQGPWGFLFAFKVLPVIVFFGAFMALLFHFGIVQKVVLLLERVIRPVLGTSGAETLCAVANSFLGQTESPLLIRHYLKSMTRSELLVVMVSGMGTISGAILVVFAAMGVPVQHLLSASVMAIPATVLIAKILCPETERSDKDADVIVDTVEAQSSNVFDAISQGTVDGLHLALNVGAMLISFLALFALVNSVLAYITVWINWLCMYGGLAVQMPTLSIAYIFSYVFAPFGYLLGFTGREAHIAGQLIGTKVAVNEVIAYSQMVTLDLSERTVSIMTYALCGFSNVSCIGIQVGSIGALVPSKRKQLTELGMYAVLGGALANLLSAMVAALLL